MHKHGYNFPVLLAKQFVDNLPVASGIPRNWIADARGKWLWDESGFDPDEKWVESTLQKIEQARQQSDSQEVGKR